MVTHDEYHTDDDSKYHTNDDTKKILEISVDKCGTVRLFCRLVC
jgi:hypothetical protein